MRKKLNYGVNSTPGWNTCNIYGEKEINIIDDPTTGKQNKRKDPKVSVPSPFARFELVQKAFSNVTMKGQQADIRDLILVSHALDVFELFFEGAEGMEVYEWHKIDALKDLQNSTDDGHKLYGESLKLYMRQENYGFDEKKYHRYNNVKIDDAVIYILTYHREPVGCTSPTSMFMATSRYSDFQDLRIEGDIPLFGRRRMLAERDDAFIEYVYRHVAYMRRETDVIAPLQQFIEFLDKQLAVIKTSKPHLFTQINHLNYSEENMYEEYEKSSFNVLGFCLFRRKAENLQGQIVGESAFIVNSAKSTKRPLILTNNSSYNGWPYISRSKVYNSRQHQIDYSNLPLSQTHKRLPGTEIDYEEGWLCENDFLSDVIIQLPYPLDCEHFFNGNLVNPTKYYYLPPIRSKYFEFFDINTLFDPYGTSDRYGNDPIFKMEELKKGNEVTKVTVTLQIPVRSAGTVGQMIKLVREYVPSEDGLLSAGSSSRERSVGRIVECPIVLNIFPFARLAQGNHYDLQLIRAGIGWDSFDVKLDAALIGCNNDRNVPPSDKELVDWKAAFERNSKKTQYYAIDSAFDYLRVKITDGVRNHESLIIPKWGSEHKGGVKYQFAFDFGTTNSHVAIRNQTKDEIVDFKIGKSIVSTLDQRRMNDGVYGEETTTITLLDVAMKQEFLPKEIGAIYSFPLRTVVLRNSTLSLDTTTPKALLHVNIPFIYGKEDCGQSNVSVPNLKWSVDEVGQKLSNSFIEELAILARAFALENDGNLAECSFVWTYPLSMRSGDVSDFNDKWKQNYKTYFVNDIDVAERNVTKVSESIAPLLYYQDSKRDLENMGVSIDIGGGTCDVVIKRNSDDIRFTSFRFAADVIFGAGKASDNPMIQNHYRYFLKLLQENGDAKKVIDIMRMACEGNGASTEANSVLFALEGHPLLSKLQIEDKSYNIRLKMDRKRKVIFLYFYAAIVYYLTKLMQDYHYPQPARLMFSGTGSKLLNIIGNDDVLQDYTTSLIQIFSGGEYNYNKPIDIIIERKEPKQITAKGALHKIDPDDKNDVAIRYSIPKTVEKDTIRYSLLKDENGEAMKLMYEDLKDVELKQRVCAEVQNFHKMFISCFTVLNFVDDYHCDDESLKLFIQLLSHEDLMAYMDTEIRDFDRVEIQNHPTHPFEGSLFFYPIKHLIQNQIIPNFK